MSQESTVHLLIVQPDPARALATLERIASLVKPIMRKHSWTLPVLAEFFPDDPSLLGERISVQCDRDA